jgi:hypothetical protein
VNSLSRSGFHGSTDDAVVRMNNAHRSAEDRGDRQPPYFDFPHPRIDVK